MPEPAVEPAAPVLPAELRSCAALVGLPPERALTQAETEQWMKRYRAGDIKKSRCIERLIIWIGIVLPGSV